MPVSARRSRPYLALGLVTISLIVLLGAVGTISYLLGFTGYTPLAVAFGPLAIGVAFFLTARRRWRAVGFGSLRAKRADAIIAVALAAVLPIGVVAGSNGFSASGTQILVFAFLAALVAFVEESIFRGILLRAFAARTSVEAIIATSTGFAIAHSATVLSPDQSLGATARTIAFAFLFGVVAALLVHSTGSIWPTIALHATFNFAGFILTPRSEWITDALSIVLALAIIVALIIRIRIRNRG